MKADIIIGTARKNNSCIAYSLITKVNGDLLIHSPDMINEPNITVHKVVLMLMSACVKTANKTIDKFNFFTDCYEIDFEYNEEYLKDGMISDDTVDLADWNELLTAIANRKAKMTVMSNSCLDKLVKKANRRAKNVSKH